MDNADPVTADLARARYADSLCIILLIVLWFVAIAVANPIGDFPVADDWSYAASVRGLVDRGEIAFTGWVGANMISQFAWGALFGAAFGTSYTVLRISTLAAATVTLLALYRLLRMNRASPGLALLGTLTLMFNPLFFLLSFSFMSDVPYAAAQTVAMWLLATGAVTGTRMKRVAGWAVGVAALLCRQFGMAIALGSAGERLSRERGGAGVVLRALIPVLVFGVIQLLYQRWFHWIMPGPSVYGLQIDGILGGIIHRPLFTVGKAVQMLVYTFFYLGLFSLPLSLALVSRWTGAWSTRRRVGVAFLGAILAAAITAVVTLYWRPFPMLADTLRAHQFGADETLPAAPEWFTLAVTALAAASGLLFLQGMYFAVAELIRRRGACFDVSVFALLTGASLTCALALAVAQFDRYFIPVFPCAFIVLITMAPGRRPSRSSLRAGFLGLAIMAAITLCGTRDFLETKRVHWAAYTTLARAVPADHIDGGWVYNAPVSFGRYGGFNLHKLYKSRDYIVGPVPAAERGYRIVARYPVNRWLPWTRGQYPVLVQQRVAGS